MPRPQDQVPPWWHSIVLPLAFLVPMFAYFWLTDFTVKDPWRGPHIATVTDKIEFTAAFAAVMGCLVVASLRERRRRIEKIRQILDE